LVMLSAIVQVAHDRKPLASVPDRAASATAAVPIWILHSSTSAMDDSSGAFLENASTVPVHGWPGQEVYPTLIIRCREHALDMYVNTGFAAQPEIGKYEEASIRYRIDDASPIASIAAESTDQKGLFFKNPAAMVGRLKKAKRLSFEFTPFNSGLAVASFNVADLASALQPLRDACPKYGI